MKLTNCFTWGVRGRIRRRRRCSRGENQHPGCLCRSQTQAKRVTSALGSTPPTQGRYIAPESCQREAASGERALRCCRRPALASAAQHRAGLARLCRAGRASSINISSDLRVHVFRSSTRPPRQARSKEFGYEFREESVRQEASGIADLHLHAGHGANCLSRLRC